MIQVDIPGRGNYKFEYLLLDLNGTLTLDGEIIEGVQERLAVLRERLDILIVTADTLGKAQSLGDALGVRVHKLERGGEQAQKCELARRLGPAATVSIGNGANDAAMLKESVLGICVLGPEGASSEAAAASVVLAPDINAALDLLVHPVRLVATLRK